MESNHAPWVLVIGGHDPTGGAGIQADIETLLSLGCRPASIITCLTAQDSNNVTAVFPQPADQLKQQLRLLLDDFGTPAAIKTGLLGDQAIAETLSRELAHLAAPLVVDPVLAAGGGQNLSTDSLIEAIGERLLPIATLATPNLVELERLTRISGDQAQAANALLDRGCENVLVTDADSGDDPITNRLYRAGRSAMDFCWNRIEGPRAGRFHGTGCTLASAAAALLAHQENIVDAVGKAQQFVAHSLEHSLTPGQGQAIPNRGKHPIND